MPQSIPTLQELAFMYGTDKLDHGYIPFYEEFLLKNPKKILEIGIKEGRSAQMWLKYFPEAEIHGLDLFKEDPVPFQDPRVTWHKGNQIDWQLLERLRNEKFDIIIEDASHDCRKHWITLFGLIDTCQQYFIEDLHTCEEEFYREGLRFEHTVLGSILDNKFPFNWRLSGNQHIVLITPKD